MRGSQSKTIGRGLYGSSRVAIKFANHLPNAPSRRRWSWLAQMLRGYHHGIRLPHPHVVTVVPSEF